MSAQPSHDMTNVCDCAKVSKKNDTAKKKREAMT